MQLTRYLMIPLGVLLSASAQIMLKKASGFSNWSTNWTIFLVVSGVLYLAALFVYLYLMRLYPISRIYPILTVLVIVVITIYGAAIGELISIKHLVGLVLGAASVYLLLS